MALRMVPCVLQKVRRKCPAPESVRSKRLARGVRQYEKFVKSGAMDMSESFFPL